MKKLHIIIFILLISKPIFSQYRIAPEKFWIQFTDKNNSPFSLDMPQFFLSQRAIDRRTRYNIAYDFLDLPVNQTYIDSLKALGMQIINTSKWLNGAIVKTNDTLLLDTITKISFIKDFELKKEKVNKIIPTLQKNNIVILKRDFVEDNYSVYDYGESFNQIELSNGHVLHNKGFDGKGMQVAILDAGFFKVNELDGFDSLWAENRILGTRDFVKGNAAEISFGTSTHGMQVLSTMAGNIPGHLVGTAPKASYYLLRSEDGTSENIIEEFNWVSAAEYADSLGVDVINTSLGYRNFDDATVNHTYEDLDGKSTVISRAATICARKGMLVVASAGNDGLDTENHIASPADADSILTVGAIDYAGNYSYFSSIGPTADWRTKPNVMAKGSATTVQSTSGGVSVSYGTSFSSPVMAGMMTSLWQAFPTVNNIELIKAVELFSSNYESPTPKMGNGIPDFAKTYLYLDALINENFEKNKPYKIYPNPSKDNLNINFISNENKKFKIEILNTLGQIEYIKEFELPLSSYYHLEISDLANKNAGIYIIKISTDKQIFQERIFKN